MYSAITVLVLIAAMSQMSDGASRSGSSYRSSSYRSSSYRSSSYRSSSYRSYSSYLPSVRYSRSYYSGVYYYYYSMYYSYYPAGAATGTTYNNGASGNICKNYEVNSNGTTLGTFKCPLPFEPASYTYCCGQKEVEHCCAFKDSKSMVGMVIGIIALLAIGIVIVFCIIKWKKNKMKTEQDNSNSLTQRNIPPPSTGSYPQGTYNHAVQNSTSGYDNQYQGDAPPYQPDHMTYSKNNEAMTGVQSQDHYYPPVPPPSYN